MDQPNNIDIEAIFNKALSAHLNDDSVIAIAVSGGGDSMALLVAIVNFIKVNKFDIKIIALTVDHKLRTNSAVEAKVVAKWCLDLGVEHHVLIWQFDQIPTSAIQEKARIARHQLLADYCYLHQINQLYFAHNLEDNAETFLMRLKRGASLRGLASIVPHIRRHENDIELAIIRPFLGQERQELRRYLVLKKQDYINDPSNENEKFERVRVRRFLEQNELLTNEQVSRSATRLARADAAVEFYVSQFFDKKVNLLNYGIAKISMDDFNNVPIETQLRILARLIWTIGGQIEAPRWLKLESLQRQMHEQSSNGRYGLGNCLVIIKRGYMWIGFENRHSNQQDCINLLPKETVLWQNRLQVNNDGDQDIIVTYLYAGLENVDEFLNNHKILRDCPHKIIQNLPVITTIDRKIIFPDLTENMQVKMQLKLRY